MTTNTRRLLIERTYQKFPGSPYALVHGICRLERLQMTNRIVLIPKPPVSKPPVTKETSKCR